MMHVPHISNLLGLSGPQKQPQPGGDADPAFAQLLASVPVPSAPQSPAAPAALVLPPVAVPPVPVSLPVSVSAPVSVPVPTSAKVALPTGLEPGLAVLETPAPVRGGKAAPVGKSIPDTGKALPELPLAIAVPLPASLPAKALDETRTAPPETELPEATTSPLAFADLALLQGGNGLAAAMRPGPVKRPTAAPVEQQMAAAAALNVPTAQLPARAAKDRAPVGSDTAAPVAPENAAAPPVIAAIPLTRAAHDRLPLAPRAAEPALFAAAVPQLADSQSAAPEATANAPVTEQAAAPEIELGTVIDRLVESRIQSREGRSEVNVPHPDFGRVTLALSLVGADRLAVAMPDAPAELRAAVGQAFAPPSRNETAPPAPATDSSFTSANDARSQDTRRDQQSSNGRGDPSRANTYGESNRQFTTNRDNRREASGRGVLA